MKRKMRSAFSMITAIFVIVLMATVAVFILSLSGKMVKGTSAQFFREQSALLAKSYTEYAIMAVTANDRNNSSGSGQCLDNIRGKYGIYTVEVKLSYLGTNDVLGNANCGRILAADVNDTEIPLSVLIDVFVRYSDPDRSDRNVTYHRRTLQKI
ncbi:type II secretion system protein [Nitratifractor sp.]|uniref:type II secretion system protein n=1 Tax=Nitratifractor sp. TaxID=2268144 RepID=UPI0025F8B6BC|nr:type II secretion system protein [Nitratifractor sp.]